MESPLHGEVRGLLAELELEGLNDVTAARYGFRPSELAAWRKLQ